MLLTMNSILARLDEMVPDDGAVSATKGASPDPLTTAQVLVLASEIPAVADLLRDRTAEGAAYLAQAQQGDGRWMRDNDDWHTSITAWSVLALRRTPSGVRYRDAVDAGSAWLRARQTEDGGFSQSNVVRRANTYSSSYSTAALFADAGLDDSVHRGLGWLAAMQATDGGFADDCTVVEGTDPSLTAYVLHAISPLPFGATAQIIEPAERYIAAVQRPSGAWSAWYEAVDSIEGTAAALRILQRSKRDHGAATRKGLAFLDSAVDLADPENWIFITLAYVAAGRAAA